MTDHRRATRWLAIIAVMMIAAFMHLYLLNSYPTGLDPDAAQDGMDALKPLRYNVWPFYIAINSNPDPMYVYTAALTTQLFGARAISMRFASVIYGLWGIAATYLCLAELGRGSFDADTRRVIALLASAALAVCEPLAFFDRMALRFITELPVQMLAVWALAKAARTGVRRDWIWAGVLAGLTQYTYPSARVLPLLFFLVLALKYFQEKHPFQTFLAGLAVWLAALLIVLLPQLIWYAYYPQTFLARAGQTSFTQNPLYAEQGWSGVFITKFQHYREALFDYWPGQYNQIYEPLLAPMFGYAFLLGLAASAVYFRKWFVPLVWCGLLVMLLPDLISGDRDWPHEFRLIGAYPFVAAVAGLGLGIIWSWTKRWANLRRLASAILIAGVAITSFQQAREFFGEKYSRIYWGGSSWLRQNDNRVGELLAVTSQSVVMPLQNYADTPIKYLVSERAAQIRSALDAEGNLLPILQDQNTAQVLLPLGDDGQPWQGDASQWVMLSGRTVYVMPPLDPAAMTPLLPPQDDAAAVYALGDYANSRIGHWASVTASQLPFAPHYAAQAPANACFAAGMCLIGASFDSAHLQPGGQLRVNLHWRMAHPAKDDYILFVHLLDGGGNAIVGKDEFPLYHAYRTYEWRTHETIITQTVLDVSADTRPGAYAIEAGFFLSHDPKRIATVDGNGQPTGDRAYVERLKVARPAIQFPADAAKTEIRFGDELKLAGYRIDAAQPLRLTLWWRALKPASQNWTSFFHFTPEADNINLVGQLDHPLTGSEYPPIIWDVGELIEEQIEIDTSNAAPGKYALWMGLYSPMTFERMPVTFAPGPIQDNRALLLQIEIP